MSPEALARRLIDCHKEDAPTAAGWYLRRALEQRRREDAAKWRRVVRICRMRTSGPDGAGFPEGSSRGGVRSGQAMALERGGLELQAVDR